jgi:hypothetical protein
MNHLVSEEINLLAARCALCKAENYANNFATAVENVEIYGVKEHVYYAFKELG